MPGSSKLHGSHNWAVNCHIDLLIDNCAFDNAFHDELHSPHMAFMLQSLLDMAANLFGSELTEVGLPLSTFAMTCSMHLQSGAHAIVSADHLLQANLGDL